MNKHKVTKRQLHKCLRTVQDHCLSSDAWIDESFQEYCRNPHNVELLQTLCALNAIQFSSIDGLPICAYPLDAAGKIWLENSEKWKDRFWGVPCRCGNNHSWRAYRAISNRNATIMSTDTKTPRK